MVPLGVVHLELGGCHFTWRKVTTIVHNIIVGKLWVDHQGEMELRNHDSGHACHLKFLPYSYFSREPPRKVTGVVTDPEGTALCVLQGSWDSQLEYARVVASRGSVRGKALLESATPKVVWRRNMPRWGSHGGFGGVTVRAPLAEWSVVTV